MTGGTGTIGRHVVAELAARGHEVRALSRHAERYAVDLTTGAGLTAALAGVDVVVDASNASSSTADARATLVDGTQPDGRTAALTALLSASGNLHQFDPEIPWTSSVIHRAKEFENGNWGAAAAGAAITRATIAVISGALGASTAADTADGS